jgi:hypothetical protein
VEAAAAAEEEEEEEEEEEAACGGTEERLGKTRCRQATRVLKASRRAVHSSREAAEEACLAVACKEAMRAECSEAVAAWSCLEAVSSCSRASESLALLSWARVTQEVIRSWSMGQNSNTPDT